MKTFNDDLNLFASPKGLQTNGYTVDQITVMIGNIPQGTKVEFEPQTFYHLV